MMAQTDYNIININFALALGISPQLHTFANAMTVVALFESPANKAGAHKEALANTIVFIFSIIFSASN